MYSTSLQPSEILGAGVRLVQGGEQWMRTFNCAWTFTTRWPTGKMFCRYIPVVSHTLISQPFGDIPVEWGIANEIGCSGIFLHSFCCGGRHVQGKRCGRVGLTGSRIAFL